MHGHRTDDEDPELNVEFQILVYGRRFSTWLPPAWEAQAAPDGSEVIVVGPRDLPSGFAPHLLFTMSADDRAESIPTAQDSSSGTTLFQATELGEGGRRWVRLIVDTNHPPSSTQLEAMWSSIGDDGIRAQVNAVLASATVDWPDFGPLFERVIERSGFDGLERSVRDAD